MSLYRRRRPLTFSDMTGQEHITRTLGNALMRGSLAHAYLFCGPRGTGKTTTAKILARAMNCLNYPTAEPCGKCHSCLNIATGSSIDVVEMDAASNRGIDEIRELRERTRYASGESRYKVYIIDEAHMLTTEACNAFLKTLEEPPSGVVFILATTDPSRLPSTIVSRCQRFDFHLLTKEQILLRLEQVLKSEQWSADQEALQLIAGLADGSLRDALGIMEQCQAYGDQLITSEHVRTVTGATQASIIDGLIKAAADNNLDKGLAILDEVIYSGRDLNLFLRDLVSAFSRLMQKAGTSKEGKASCSPQASDLSLSKEALLDAVELLYQAGGEVRNTHFPRYILEVTFIRLLRVLHGRLKLPEQEREEEIVEHEPAAARGAVPVKPVSPPAKKEPESEPVGLNKSAGAPAKEPETVETSAGPDTGVRLSMIRKAWPSLLQKIKKSRRSTAAWLVPATVHECRGHLVIFAYTEEYDLHHERIMEEGHRGLIESELSAFAGAQVKIKSIIQPCLGDNSSQKLCAEPAEPEQSNQSPGLSDGMEIFNGNLVDDE